MMRLLLEKGATLRPKLRPGVDTQNLLHIAAEYGSANAMKYLLDNSDRKTQKKNKKK